MTATGSSNSATSESLEFLIAMMGDNIDRNVARRVLDKFNGDVEKAADSLLSGETPPPESTAAAPYKPPPSSPTNSSMRLAPTSMIDLTMDEAPHPEWAVVPTSQTTDTRTDLEATQNDDIHRAIQESLAYAGSVEDIHEELSPEDRVRKDNRPVVLRPQDSKIAHVGLLWQALFHVPQVRYSIAGYRGPTPHSMVPNGNGELEVDPPTEGPEGQVWSLVELFGYAELANLAEMTGMPTLERFELQPWSNLMLGSQTSDLLKDLAWAVEGVLNNGIANGSHKWNRLFHSRLVPNDFGPKDFDDRPLNNASDFSVIDVHYNDQDGKNDLVGCLATQFFPPQPSGLLNVNQAKGELFSDPAEVLAFYPIREEALPAYSTGKASDRKKFKFPKFFYFDRFTLENEGLARKLTWYEKEELAEIKALVEKKEALTHFDNKDTLANLRASIYYYENVADADEDLERKANIDAMAKKLKDIVVKIENEIATIDKEISDLKTKSSTLFDTPDLQKHRYDLRAVLMHDGLYGRKHIYSYVLQDETWWKTLDHTVTEVSEETVFNDKNGLHLGTGPYLLLYSRAIPESLRNTPMPWPDVVKDGARRDSEIFFNELPPDVRAKAYNPEPSVFPLSNPHSPTTVSMQSP